MTTVRTLFDNPPPPKLARKTDPETSHDAAQIAPVTTCEDRFFYILLHHGPMTSKECAAKCMQRFDPALTGQAWQDRFDTYRKRAGRLKGNVEKGIKARIVATDEVRSGCEVLRVI